MKTILIRSCIILAICASGFQIASCTSDGQLDKAKANTVVNLALDYAVKSGKVTPGDAALVREVGTIVLTQDAPAGPVTEAPVTVTK